MGQGQGRIQYAEEYRRREGDAAKGAAQQELGVLSALLAIKPQQASGCQL